MFFFSPSFLVQLVSSFMLGSVLKLDLAAWLRKNFQVCFVTVKNIAT